MDSVEVLTRARGIYEAAPSHAQPNRNTESGTYCIASALGAAWGGPSFVGSTAYGTLYNLAGGSLVAWNAEHSTEEVLALFDAAIEAERAQVPASAHWFPSF